MTDLFIDEPPYSPAWSLGAGNMDSDCDGAPHGANLVLGSCKRTPKFPPFCLKNVHFLRTPFSVLIHQDSPCPRHRHNEEPASGPASWVQPPSLGGFSWVLEGPLPLSLGSGGSGGSQSIPVWVLPSSSLAAVVSMATRSPCRRGILGLPLPAPHLYSQPLSPAQRWQPARPGIHFKAAFVFYW